MRRRHKGLKLTLVILLLIIGFAFGYYLNSFLSSGNSTKISLLNKKNKIVNEHKKDILNDNADNGTEVVKNSINITEEDENSDKETQSISENTNVTFVKDYIKCGHKSYESFKGYQDMIKMSQEDIKEFYPQWELTKFTESEVVLNQKIDQKCFNHYIVKEYSGGIGIFYQNQSAENSLKQVVSIDVRRLRAEDRKKLIEGIFVESDYELTQLLEDFGS